MTWRQQLRLNLWRRSRRPHWQRQRHERQAAQPSLNLRAWILSQTIAPKVEVLGRPIHGSGISTRMSTIKGGACWIGRKDTWRFHSPGACMPPRVSCARRPGANRLGPAGPAAVFPLSTRPPMLQRGGTAARVAAVRRGRIPRHRAPFPPRQRQAQLPATSALRFRRAVCRRWWTCRVEV